MSAPRALWITAPGAAEIRDASLGEGVALRMLWSGISRGTERLVCRGAVPQSEVERMRAPHQEGSFPFPVKYGYAAVARVEEGASAGQKVFALFPHQTRFCLLPDQIVPLPEGLPPQRAVLAANMETALNILWDSGAGAGDRIAVMGAGVVGALVGFLCARLPGCEVTLVDVDPARGALARSLGCAFAEPTALTPAQDVIINTSGSSSALTGAFEIAGPGATVVEASWHGAALVEVPLGGAFHSQRLRLVSSQVGALPPARLPRWTHRRRLEKALELLLDERVDLLISGESDFEDLPHVYARVLEDPVTLCHRIRYD